MTLEGLAEVLGLSHQQVYKYECGTTRVTAGRLAQIAAVLNAPLAYFIEGSNVAIKVADPTLVEDVTDSDQTRSTNNVDLASTAEELKKLIDAYTKIADFKTEA